MCPSRLSSKSVNQLSKIKAFAVCQSGHLMETAQADESLGGSSLTAQADAQGEDPSLVSQMSRDSGMSMNSLQTGYSGDTGSLPSSLMGAHNDWEIAPMDIEILRREDGSPWELGAGAFGKVQPLQAAACTSDIPLRTCMHRQLSADLLWARWYCKKLPVLDLHPLMRCTTKISLKQQVSQPASWPYVALPVLRWSQACAGVQGLVERGSGRGSEDGGRPKRRAAGSLLAGGGSHALANVTWPGVSACLAWGPVQALCWLGAPVHWTDACTRSGRLRPGFKEFYNVVSSPNGYVDM